MSRAERIDGFLPLHGWGGAERRPLAGDASFRRYERITRNGRRAVLMDAPPPQEDVRPFVRLARHLCALGLSAPEVLAEDPADGFVLLEDLGDLTYTRVLANPDLGPDEETLYRLAIDVLIHLHRQPNAIPSGLPPYDENRLLTEAHLLTDWFMPAALGRATGEADRHAFADAWRPLFAALAQTRPVLVLRDYHGDNLMWLPGRTGAAACGVLDFQDAVAGHPAYDLMSLLEDARRDIRPDLIAAMKARYMAAFPKLERDAFETAFAILAAQRHAKVIGIFTRLCVRDGKSDYLQHIPRVWRLLHRALHHPALATVRAWLDRNVPAASRGIPPCKPGRR
ncbi:MAG: aminoglycoside phosphotransferase [Rhodospirillales bacterium]|nr:aminoglycoside phosphotransferase [Rhodospirillales bacterium]